MRIRVLVDYFRFLVLLRAKLLVQLNRRVEHAVLVLLLGVNLLMCGCRGFSGDDLGPDADCDRVVTCLWCKHKVQIINLSFKYAIVIL